MRVGYNSSELWVNLAVADQWLWAQTVNGTKDPSQIPNWDSASIYIDLVGLESGLSSSAYRFDASMNGFNYPDNSGSFQAYRGNGSGFSPSTTAFTYEQNWRGDGPNDNVADRGWYLTFHIPFGSLGLSGPPSGTWALGAQVHNCNGSDGTKCTAVEPAISWPESFKASAPSSWGQLHFGPAPAYSTNVQPTGSVTTRQGLNGATVTDATVGSIGTCGTSNGVNPDFFSNWGTVTNAGATQTNVQNEKDIADWPCFSKFYVTFPLDQIPAGNTVTSAQLTLYMFGNAGDPNGSDCCAQPSLIQVMTVGQDVSNSSSAWNNAPPPRENVGQTMVNPCSTWPSQSTNTCPHTYDGLPVTWDVSGAVAEAAAAGQPLRLVLYESDAAYHSGKYFYTSEVADFAAAGRPKLVVNFG